MDGWPVLAHTACVSDLERQKDKGRIDRLLDAIEAELGLGPGASEDDRVGADVLIAGSKAVALLLERRSKLLGLDAPAGTEPAQGPSAVARILSAVPK